MSASSSNARVDPKRAAHVRGHRPQSRRPASARHDDGAGRCPSPATWNDREAWEIASGIDEPHVDFVDERSLAHFLAIELVMALSAVEARCRRVEPAERGMTVSAPASVTLG